MLDLPAGCWLTAWNEGSPMRLLIVNPNTSADMTATILATAKAAVGPGVQVDACNPARGPASVEGQFDEVVSAYCTLETVLPIADQYDGLVLACYGHHPVIGALREALDQPVLGIMEASILHALPLGDRFSIVTSSPRWCPLLEEGVRALGVEQRCASVRSSGLAVLDIAALSEDEVVARLCAEARAAGAGRQRGERRAGDRWGPGGYDPGARPRRGWRADQQAESLSSDRAPAGARTAGQYRQDLRRGQVLGYRLQGTGMGLLSSLVPDIMVVHRLIYEAVGNDVETVIVDGKARLDLAQVESLKLIERAGCQAPEISPRLAPPKVPRRWRDRAIRSAPVSGRVAPPCGGAG